MARAGLRWRAATASTSLRFRRFAEFVVADRGPLDSLACAASDQARHRAPPAARSGAAGGGVRALADRPARVGGRYRRAGIAFAGPSSRGKSTLAASFAARRPPGRDRRLPHAGLASAEPRAVPSYPSLRLWKSTADRLFGPDARPGAGGASTPRSFAVGARVVRPSSFGGGRYACGRIYVIDRRAGPAAYRPVVPPPGLRRAAEDRRSVSIPLDRVTARREVAALAAIAQLCRWPACACRCGWTRSAMCGGRSPPISAGTGPASVIQLTRSGLCVSSPDEVGSAGRGVCAAARRVAVGDFSNRRYCDVVASDCRRRAVHRARARPSRSAGDRSRPRRSRGTTAACSCSSTTRACSVSSKR